MPFQNDILAGVSGSSSGEDAYSIDNSIRFAALAATQTYLTRTNTSSGNLRTWTYSIWIKRGEIDGEGAMVDGRETFQALFSCTNGSYWSSLGFQSSRIGTQAGRLIFEDKYYVGGKGGATNTYTELKSSASFRDPAAWYHVVVRYDTTQATSTNRVRIYVNGDLLACDTCTYPDQNYDGNFNFGNGSAATYIGRRYHPTAEVDLYDGYVAEVFFLDGESLGASSFGETNETTGQWIPKDCKDDLTFGTNGFYLDFENLPTGTSYTSSTTWTCPTGVTSVEYLVVAGGGGGGSSHPEPGNGYTAGGAGGAGGFRTGTLSVTPGSDYTITIGAGGSAGSASSGGDGADSVFSSITSTGGGGGGRGLSAGRSGGSGGGGGSNASGASGTAGQGNSGGSSPAWGGGGGGGASAAGTAGDTGTNSYGGAGGAGTASTLSGSSVTYAGGGGGGSTSGDQNAAGGSGGGGVGGSYDHTDATAGTANTGGGGGGAGGVSSLTLDGAAGGSGIVILSTGSLGQDGSGEGNDLTLTNLASTDQMIDTPTNNFPTWNEFTRAPYSYGGDFVALFEGNLQGSWTSNDDIGVKGTMAFPTTGKWYYEMLVTGGAPYGGGVGAIDVTVEADGNATRTGTYIYGENGTIYANGTTYSSAGATFTTDDITSALVDSDASKIYFYKNNVLQGAAGGYTIGAGQELTPWSVWHNVTTVANFGQDSSFAGNKTAQGNQDSNDVGDFYYTPPSSSLALCTDNLPTPSIVLPGEYFNTKLYTGTGSSQSITGVGFQPDMTWIKSRTTTHQHMVFDVNRAVTDYIVPDATDAEATDAGQFTAFDSDGFSLGSGSSTNATSANFVSWNWKAGGTGVSNTDGSITSTVSADTTSGFSIVKWTGTGSNATVGHGLSQAPDLVINKSLNNGTSSQLWAVQSILWNSASDTNMLYLNNTSAQADDTNVFQAAPTASVFSPQGGAWPGIGVNAIDYIAYCFHSVEGYSKIGSYEGNNDDRDGTFTFTGFKPAYVMIKRATAVEGWMIYDNKISPHNEAEARLQANLINAEDTTENGIDMVSNGFECRTNWAGINASSDYMYIAFAEAPFKYSNAR